MPYTARISTRAFLPFFFLLLFVPFRLAAQKKAYWEVTHEPPPVVFGDTTGSGLRVNFNVPGNGRADNIDGAEGTHYGAWGRIDQGGSAFHVLWVSSDSGMNWSEAHRSEIEGPGGSIPQPAWAFTDISCPEPDHIFLLTLDNPPSQSASVLKSTDGGATWQRRNLPGTTGWTQQGQIAMADARHGAVMLQSADGFFRTSDGGETWHPVSFPPAIFHDLFCPEPDVYIATGSYAARTTDGGATWSSPASGPFGLLTPFTYSFADKDYGWAVAAEATGVGDRVRNRIARTTDGGMTWTELLNDEKPAGGTRLLSIDFADRMNGLAAGWLGIYRTTDGGISWGAENLPRDEPRITAVLCPTPTSGVALAHNILTCANRQTLPAPVITQPGPLLQESKDTVTIAWTPVEDAVRYQVQMGRYKPLYRPYDFTDMLMVDAPDLTATFRFFELEYGDWTYIFRVRAMNDQDTSQWSAAGKVLLIDSPNSLTAPKVLFPRAFATEVPATVELRWSAVPEATRYHLRVGTEPPDAGGTQFVIDMPSMADTFHTVELNPHTTYFCGVKALNDAGESKWSSQLYTYYFTTGTLSGIDDGRALRLSAAIAPNPTRGSATLAVAEHPEEIDILDLNGRRFSVPFPDPVPGPDGEWTVELDLNALPAGMYIVKVRSNAGITTERLLVR